MAAGLSETPQKIERSKPQSETAALTHAVSELMDALRQMRRKRIDCGKVIFHFQDSQKPSFRTLAIEQLADAAGLCRRTAFSYLQLYRDAQIIGTELLLKAEESGINIDSPSEIGKLKETKTNLPELSEEAIIAKTIQKLAAMKAKRAVARKHADPMPNRDGGSPEGTGGDPTVDIQLIEISTGPTSSMAEPQSNTASATIALRKPPVSIRSNRNGLVQLAYENVQSVFRALDDRERKLAIQELCIRLQSDVGLQSGGELA